MRRRWKVLKVTQPSKAMRKDGPNTIIETTAGIVIYTLVEPYSSKEQLLIYYTADGWVGYLTGTEGKNVTERLPQEKWEELYSHPQAVLAMTGDIRKTPLKEIF